MGDRAKIPVMRKSFARGEVKKEEEEEKDEEPL